MYQLAAMPSSKLQGPLSSLQDVPSEFSSKVQAPRNPKLSRREEAAVTVIAAA